MSRRTNGDNAASPRKATFTTMSGMEVPAAAGPADLAGWDPQMALGSPGQYPFTRGIHPAMYRQRLWTMRQYAGFGDADGTNQRFRYLLAQGQMGLSVAFDLPTQMGLDSDHALADGEVGRVGVAIDTLADMERLFRSIPLDRISTSMTINAPAAILMLMYAAVAKGQGVAPERIRGTIQNDILKEYVARGTYIFPIKPSMRLVTDTFAYAARQLPQFTPISISGYHIREAGSTAPQEIAFTLANGLAYVRAAVASGLDLDEFAGRLSFFFNAHSDFFEEAAKFRAARRIWADLMRREGALSPQSWQLRFHAQTAGSALTAQQPDVNIVRVALQALSAVLGGTQSLHTNAYDEALALPTEASARLALRTQQVIASETGVADTVDPLAGSYWVERLTNQLEKEARDYLARVEQLGGAVEAIRQGYMQREIQDAAYAFQRQVERGEREIVGVNVHQMDEQPLAEIYRQDRTLAARQIASLTDVRKGRDSGQVQTALARVGEAAQSGGNLLEPLAEAVLAYATVQEMCDRLRAVFGVYREGSA